jgi:hypothetical protein
LARLLPLLLLHQVLNILLLPVVLPVAKTAIRNVALAAAALVVCRQAHSLSQVGLHTQLQLAAAAQDQIR